MTLHFNYDKQLLDAVREVISLLVQDDFDTLEHRQMLGPATVEEYKAALSRYLRGRESLTEPSLAAFDTLNIFETTVKNEWRIDFDLWTNREISDLTAQIYVREEPAGTYHLMLYDIRVL